MTSKTNNKAIVNYVVDLIIAVGFVLVVVSGIVLLAAGPGGYHGGRNPYAMREVLNVSRWTWKALHDWGGIAFAVGALLHLVLHWKWVACMTRKLLHRRRRPVPASAGAPQCQMPEG